MKNVLFTTTGLALLICGIGASLHAIAEEPVAPANGGPAVPLPGPVSVVVLDGDGAVAVDAELPKDGQQIAEPINLNVITAPLKALFGITEEVDEMGLELAAPILEFGFPDVDGAVDQKEALVMQFQQQYRPFLNEELGFIRLSCNHMSVEQRLKVKRAGEAGLKEAAVAMAEQQQAPNQGRHVGVRKPPRDLRTTIRTAIDKTLQETLTEEQFASYRQEADARLKRRKHAAIVSIVSRLDGCLFLNAQQRQTIVDSLSSNWEDKWEQWLMISAWGDQYFPLIPNELIVPHLNVNQKSVWEHLQKIDFGDWWAAGVQNNQNDGWWGDEAQEGADQPNPAMIQIQFGS